MKKSVIIYLAVLFNLLALGSLWAQESEIQLPEKNTAEYWVVRSRAVSELITFLTKKRKDLTADLNHFTRFLEKIDKEDDFTSSTVEVPEGPEYRAAVLDIVDSFEETGIEMPKKPLSWEELMTVAMKFTVAEGYLSVDFKDGEELASFKKVLQSRENFLRGVRKDINMLVEACLKAWFYLGTINQQKAFKLYVFQEEQKASQEAAQKQAEARARRAEKVRGLLVESKEKELRRRQDRQDRLSRAYGYGYYGY